jgi:hypothetical protein
MFLKLAPCLLLLAACATNHKLTELSPDELAYLEKIKATPTDFHIAPEKKEEVWGRGKDFIQKFATVPLKPEISNMLETARADSVNGPAVGYRMTKIDQNDSIEVSVNCLNKLFDFKYPDEVCRSNEKIMAHYMLTGEINEKFVNAVISTEKPKKHRY